VYAVTISPILLPLFALISLPLSPPRSCYRHPTAIRSFYFNRGRHGTLCFAYFRLSRLILPLVQTSADATADSEIKPNSKDVQFNQRNLKQTPVGSEEPDPSVITLLPGSGSYSTAPQNGTCGADLCAGSCCNGARCCKAYKCVPQGKPKDSLTNCCCCCCCCVFFFTELPHVVLGIVVNKTRLYVVLLKDLSYVVRKTIQSAVGVRLFLSVDLPNSLSSWLRFNPSLVLLFRVHLWSKC